VQKDTLILFLGSRHSHFTLTFSREAAETLPCAETGDFQVIGMLAYCDNDVHAVREHFMGFPEVAPVKMASRNKALLMASDYFSRKSPQP